MSTDLQVKKKSYRNDNSLIQNHLHIEISGKSINYIIVNTLRRIILVNIPSYAFNPEKIKINKNTSVFNNNKMIERLQVFPICKIKHDLDLSEYDKLRVYTRGRKTYTDETIDDDNISNLSVLNMYLKIKNNGDNLLNVTTDDCEFYNNGEKIKSIYNNPLLVCKLKQGEEIELTAIVDKGLALNHARYSCASSCSYKEINDNSYLFKLEGNCQFSEKEILERGTEIILYILTKLKNKLVKTKYTKNIHGQIILEDYDHTIGNLLSHILQNNPNIEFAAYKMDHLLIRNVTIEYITDGSKTINEILKLSFDKLIKLYNNLLNKFKSLEI